VKWGCGHKGWAFAFLVLLLCGSMIMNGWRILEERETQYVCENR
jgi:hypothetical protein